MLSRVIFWVLLFGLIISSIVWISVRYQKNKMSNEQLLVTLGVPALALLASLPCLVDYVITGEQCMDYILRTERLADQIASGSISLAAGIAPEKNIFLWIPALFRTAGLDMVAAYNLFLFFLHLATAAIAYISFYGCFRRRIIGMLGCTLYTLAPYRLDAVYIKSALGVAVAFIFLPLIILGIYRVYTDNIRNKKKGFWLNCLVFAVGILGAISSGILSVDTKASGSAVEKSLISIGISVLLTAAVVYTICIAGRLALRLKWEVIPVKYMLLIICVISIFFGNYRVNRILYEGDNFMKAAALETAVDSALSESDESGSATTAGQE